MKVTPDIQKFVEKNQKKIIGGIQKIHWSAADGATNKICWRLLIFEMVTPILFCLYVEIWWSLLRDCEKLVLWLFRTNFLLEAKSSNSWEAPLEVPPMGFFGHWGCIQWWFLAATDDKNCRWGLGTATLMM